MATSKQLLLRILGYTVVAGLKIGLDHISLLQHLVSQPMLAIEIENGPVMSVFFTLEEEAAITFLKTLSWTLKVTVGLLIDYYTTYSHHHHK